MIRCWFFFLSSLIVTAVVTPCVIGQTASPRPTLGERMTALRQGWTPGENDQSAQQAPMDATMDEQQQSAAPQKSRSIFPKWFGRDDEQPQEARQPTQQNSRVGSARQQNQNGNNGRMINQSRGAVAQSQQPNQQNRPKSTLPGLGGSRLPRGNAAQSSNPTAGDRYASREVITDAPAQRQPTTSSNKNAGRNTLPARPTASTTTPTPSRTRNSPSRRATPHFSPDELRRELAGSFPEPVASEAPSARVAQANAPKAATVESPVDQTDEAAPTDSTAMPLDAPIDQSPVAATDESSTADPSVIQPSLENAYDGASDASDAPQSTTAAAQPGSDSRTSTPAAPPSSRNRSFGTSNFVRSPRSTSNTTGLQTVRGKEAFGEALQVASGGDPNVLVSNQTPVLSIDIRGPKQILIGREAVYRLKLQNQSEVPADGIVASIRIPSSAEIVTTTPTQGLVNQGSEGTSPGVLQWQIAHLDRHASETLEIHLVPKESKPLELGVSWTLAPVGSRAVVEVQEPKLKLDVNGPNEVLFDKPQVFQLTISNPGTGPAENVKIDLVPPGGNQDATTSHQLGDLAPGATQTIDVELTARDAGKMSIKAIASAEGGLTCDAAKEIFCRKPELEVDWRGPAAKYAGTLATYFFRVRNPGTAPADDVSVKVSLPEGAEFTSASEGQTYDAERREVSWRVGTLEPGDDSYMELKCIVRNSGANQLNVSAANHAGDLTATKTAQTNVIALADLKLEVTDPSGPVAVGSQTVYEIRVQNRGSNSAKDVNIVALFSDGIEPEQAEGAMYTVADGRVSFKTIEDLPAGRDVVLRIRAHAVQPGTHVFRAEVLCRDLEIKLAAEETTRFYADDVAPETDETQPEAANRTEAFGSDGRYR
jgi:uncharacterized repeat protein (TIGR01451 family)